MIGSELISDEVVAVTELVKNAHDADASHVVISFGGVTAGEGRITVEDDGHGMDLDTFLGRWLEPATASKALVRGRRSPAGRRLLGEKGIGRFAVDKLAAQLELVSRRKGTSTEVRATFDWDLFDDPAQTLDSVSGRWETRPAREIDRHGTILRLTALRGTWNERMFRRLSSRLTRLRPPFDDRQGMRISIESDEFPEYAGEISSTMLEKAPYRIDARFDGNGTLAVDVGGRGVRTAQWPGPGELRCGPLRLRIFAFDLEVEALARLGSRSDARAWLREWCGMSVYRDGFRVWPYGEPHDDWLRLDQRRVNNPVVCLSNNQIVGFVELTGDGNPGLRDQTNREGLVHGVEYEDLRRLVHHVLQILETDRQRRRHPQRGGRAGVGREAGARALAITRELASLSTNLGKRHASRARRLILDLDRDRQRETLELRERSSRQADLVAAGLILPIFHHWAGLQVKRAIASASELGPAMRAGADPDASLEYLRTALDALAGWLNEKGGVGTGRSTRRRTIDLGPQMRMLGATVRPVLLESGIELRVAAPAAGLLRTEMRPETFQRAFLLIVCAVAATAPRRGRGLLAIEVTARRRGDSCRIQFRPARRASTKVVPIDAGTFNLWRRVNPGLGLAIARDLATLHGGSLEGVSGEVVGAAGIDLFLPRRNARGPAPRSDREPGHRD